MRRPLVWLQLLLGWFPVWVIFTGLLLSGHPGTPVSVAATMALRMIVSAALLAVPVHRLARRYTWPRPFRASFVGLHLLGAAGYSASWIAANMVVDSIVRGAMPSGTGVGLGPYFVLGVWIYAMVAGVSYATVATERAARAEAAAARAQLAALRAQVHPHFLFNALHTVVHLIPRNPVLASRAAEQLGTLLRTTIEQDRDIVTLGEELAFVETYLEIERLRFGDRLRVRIEVAAEARDAAVPSFSVQTLVENAVRHAVAPREEPTDVVVSARVAGPTLIASVRDSGSGTPARAGTGTGLDRLRERLSALYGTRARLDVESVGGAGVTATLSVPLGGAE